MDIDDTLRHVDVLRLFLAEPFSVLATSEIEERLGLSHHPTFRKLKILETNGVLIKQKKGYSLNISDVHVQEIMRFLANIEKIQTDGSKKHI